MNVLPGHVLTEYLRCWTCRQARVSYGNEIASSWIFQQTGETNVNQQSSGISNWCEIKLAPLQASAMSKQSSTCHHPSSHTMPMSWPLPPITEVPFDIFARNLYDDLCESRQLTLSTTCSIDDMAHFGRVM